VDGTTPQAATAALSFITLIENADPIVQGVMIALAFASVLCWTIGFEKFLRYLAFLSQVRGLERFAEFSGGNVPGKFWLLKDFQHIADNEPRDTAESLSEFQGHLERAFNAEIGSHMRRLQSGLPILATVGSTAPFVGLFGTVWGIMNSFTGIANAKDTSLAVVAPGIAEALLATAIGLVAAIPAVIIYNLANVFLTNYAERLQTAAARYAKSYTDRLKRDRLTGAASKPAPFSQRVS
jgi:biopolymer transport protein ExbB/TolQ